MPGALGCCTGPGLVPAGDAEERSAEFKACGCPSCLWALHRAHSITLCPSCSAGPKPWAVSQLHSGPGVSFCYCRDNLPSLWKEKLSDTANPFNQMLRLWLTSCAITIHLSVSDLDSSAYFKESAFQIISYQLDTGQILTYFHSECSYILTVTHWSFWL